MSESQEKLTYGSYLQLDKILDAQTPISTQFGKPAHDEMLFIVIHQTYELWFKEMLHELNSVIEMFDCNFVDERSIGLAVARVQRVVEIEKLMIDQIKVLETLTPLDFLDFRNYLSSASGFQSVQFRAIEYTLGLKHEQREKYNSGDYYANYAAKDRAAIKALEGKSTLFDVVEKWLSRTPFLDSKAFSFLDAYKKAFSNSLEEDRKAINAISSMGADERALRLKMIDGTSQYYNSLLNEDSYDELKAKGQVRLTHKAFLAALFITLYRDQPILQMPYRFLETVLEVDEYLNLWRYRHALMVLRMVGHKMGTSGSTGHDYLKATVEKHKVFSDLFNLSTLLISRTHLPVLDPEFVKNLGFYYSAQK